MDKFIILGLRFFNWLRWRQIKRLDRHTFRLRSKIILLEAKLKTLKEKEEVNDART